MRDADDAIEWIQEKELLICTDDYGGDLQSVQALLAKHEGYEVSYSDRGMDCRPAKSSDKAEDLLF